ncbi:tetratricopeptide repeat protein [bacterium]|nr:MAG: tetratricopeptide repeat protein [bacterium]
MELQKSPSKELEALQKAEAAGVSVMAARNALRKGEREKARELIKEAFASNPGDITAIDLLGDMFLEEGETQQALKLYERALKAHPGHAAFEEKVAVCRLDLAEMEADRIAKATVLEFGDMDKAFERSPGKAMTLSMMLPGAGQFYNEENEKAIGYMVAGVLSFIAWSYPLMSALSKTRFDLLGAIHSISGVESFFFYVGATLWAGIYAASITGAIASAKRFNEARRASLGI